MAFAGLCVISAIVQFILVLFPHNVGDQFFVGGNNSQPPTAYYTRVPCGSILSWHPPAFSDDPAVQFLEAHPGTYPGPRAQYAQDMNACSIAHHKAELTMLWMSPPGIAVIVIMVIVGLVLLGLMFGGGGGITTIRGSSRSSIYGGESFTFRTRR
jgi:hypothetical protein